MNARADAFFKSAACQDYPTAWFFPAKGQNAAEAHVICDGCPVHDECLLYVLQRPTMEGIWSGTTSKQRRRLRAQTATQRTP